MIIERAIEKLRREGKAISPSVPVVAQPSSPPAKHTREPARQQPVVRPVFPRMAIDSASVVAHRILVPDTRASADPKVAAAYRMIRTRLLHTITTNKLTSIAITSPGAGEGKSVSSLNIALTLARDPSTNVFLLDLDLRNPSICRYLGLIPQHELLSYFTGSAPPSEVFFSIGPENLAIAGSVSTSEAASELIGSGRLEALIEYISGVASNPIVLIDLPPVLVTDEALLVAPRVDAMLLIVAEGHTRRDSLEQALNLLAEFNSAGVILNRSTYSTVSSGYYYNYYNR
jgi:protein-tyrosine kinase